MAEPEPGIPPWAEAVIAHTQRRERSAQLRKQLAEVRAAAKAIRHQQRLREAARREKES